MLSWGYFPRQISSALNHGTLFSFPYRKSHRSRGLVYLAVESNAVLFWDCGWRSTQQVDTLRCIINKIKASTSPVLSEFPPFIADIPPLWRCAHIPHVTAHTNTSRFIFSRCTKHALFMSQYREEAPPDKRDGNKDNLVQYVPVTAQMLILKYINKKRPTA